MKKPIIALFLSALLLSISVSAVQSPRVGLYIDGASIGNDMPLVFINEQTAYIPIRRLCTALRAELSWDAQTKTATVQKGDRTLLLRIHASTAQINGKAYPMDMPALLFGDTTWVPLRFVAEALLADVWYDSARQSIFVATTTNYEGYPLAPDELYQSSGYACPVGPYLYEDAIAIQKTTVAGYESWIMYAPRGNFTVSLGKLNGSYGEGFEDIKAGERYRICFFLLGGDGTNHPFSIFRGLGDLSVTPHKA